MNNKQQALYLMNKKSTGVAYLIGFFFGTLGLHHLYLGDTFNFVIRLVIFLLSLVLPPLFVASMVLYLFDGVFTYYVAKCYNDTLFMSLSDD